MYNFSNIEDDQYYDIDDDQYALDRIRNLEEWLDDNPTIKNAQEVIMKMLHFRDDYYSYDVAVAAGDLWFKARRLEQDLRFEEMRQAQTMRFQDEINKMRDEMQNRRQNIMNKMRELKNGTRADRLEILSSING